MFEALSARLKSWRDKRKAAGDTEAGAPVPGVSVACELQSTNAQLRAAQTELERRWRALSEAQRLSHTGTFLWRVVKGELAWSDETFRILGYSPEIEPTLSAMFERVHPEDLKRLRQLKDDMARDGQNFDIEHRLLMPDGTIKYVHVVAYAGPDTDTGSEYMGVVTDITERRLAEDERKRLAQALQESKTQLEEAQRVAHVGHYQLDLVEDRLTWSDELFRIYGLDPERDSIDMARVASLFHPDDRESILGQTWSAIESGTHTDIEHRIVRPDGEIRVVHGLGTIKRDAFGRAYELFGTVQDTTDRKRAEETLRRTQFYLSEGERLAHVGSWAFDSSGHYWSEELYKIYGIDPSNGAPTVEQYLELIHPQDRAAMSETIRRMQEEHCGHDLIERVIRPDGALRYIRAVANPVFDDGVFKGFIGTTMDVTEQELMAKERDRLRQLEGELAHINRVDMMGELTAALAHEIKQPIAATITSTNALIRWLNHDPPEMRRVRATAARIEQDASRAAEVINSLQSFYRKGLPSDCEPIDLKEAITEIALILRAETRRYAIGVHQEFEPGTPRIRVNRVQLQQILMNLMLNAIEAMKSTGGDLRVKMRGTAEGHLCISIADTGIGIDEGAEEKVFEPFHTTKPQGTGMGLTITRSIVESYGGRVWVDANQGPGTTFHFTLPCETEV